MPKRLALMVSYLVPDVVNHPLELRVRIRKGAEALLPREASRHPPLLVDVVGGARLDVADQIREGDIRSQTNQDMRVVRHAVDGDELLTLPGDDAGDVFLQFFFAFRANQVLPSLHGEHDLNVDLGIGVGHIAASFPEGDARCKLREKHHLPSALGLQAPLGASCL